MNMFEKVHQLAKNAEEKLKEIEKFKQEKLNELNRFSSKYTYSELRAFKGDAISIDEAKRIYPKAAIHDIGAGQLVPMRYRFCPFGKKDKNDNWAEIIFVFNDTIIAYVNFNKYYYTLKSTATLIEKPYFTIFWYCRDFGRTKTEDLTGDALQNIFVKFLQITAKVAENIKNTLAQNYPKKKCEMPLKAPISPIIYSAIKEFVSRRVFCGETTADYNAQKMITKITVKINIPDMDENAHEKLLEKMIDISRFDDIKPDTQYSFPQKFFVDFPDTCKINKEIPLSVLQKNFPHKYDLLLTLHCYVNSLRWLYKFSEKTTGLSGNRDINEIHVLLIELDDVICNGSNRKIKGITYPFIYAYGLEFATEDKFLQYLDAVIPYQTVCLFKINFETPLYRIWTGHKSITMKGSKVKKYVQSEWMDENELLKFPLVFKGNSLLEVFSNFYLQLNKMQ